MKATVMVFRNTEFVDLLHTKRLKNMNDLIFLTGFPTSLIISLAQAHVRSKVSSAISVGKLCKSL